MKLLAVSAVTLMALQQPQPPVLLDRALKTLPGVRLLESSAGAAWIVQDMDRDKRPDVVAVIVKPSPAGSEFGIIAVHARAPQDIHWIIPFDADSISGVAKGKAPDVIVPLFCVECDAHVWFRWSGGEYEADLYAVGEELTTVVVRKVGGTPEKRWYYVETPEGQRGWIPDHVTSSDICVG